MKKDISSISNAVKKIVEKTQMDVILTASSESGEVKVELTFIPRSPTPKKAGF